MPEPRPPSLLGQLARGVLFAIIRTGQCHAANLPPARYCRRCVRPRMSRLVFWTFDRPGYCAECGCVLDAQEGTGCVD